LQQKQAIDIIEANVCIASFNTNHASTNFPEASSPFQIRTTWSESFYNAHQEMVAQCTCWFVEQSSNGNQELSLGLLNALFMSVSDRQSASDVIGGLFGVKLPHCVCTYATPELQNRFRAMVSKDLGLERFTESKISNWLCQILEDCFSQKLKRSFLKPVERTRWLFLLEYFLRRCQKKKLHNLSFTLKPITLVSIGHALTTSLKTAISCNEIDSNLLEALLVCLSTLFGLPSVVVESDGFGWIADWCSDFEANTTTEEGGFIANARMYLDSVRRLSSVICNSLIDGSDPDSMAFHEYRQKLTEANCDYWEPFGEITGSTIKTMQSLENELGLARGAQSTQLINNVYASRQERGRIVIFSPDEKVRAAARRFVNEVRRTT
jgi:hypothetical protein